MQDSILFTSSPDLVEKLYENGVTKMYHEGDIILDEKFVYSLDSYCNEGND